MAPYIAESKRNYVFGGISSVAANASIKVCFEFCCSAYFSCYKSMLSTSPIYPTYDSSIGNVHSGTRTDEVHQPVRSPTNMQKFDSTRTGRSFKCGKIVF